jgi:hypothetical protein
MAIVLEMAAEAAKTLSGGMEVARVRDLQVLQGITYKDGASRNLHLETSLVPAGLDGSQLLNLSVRSAETGQVHYKAQVELRRDLPPAVLTPPLELKNPQPLPIPVHEAYASWLFHGPQWLGIAEVQALGDNGIIGTLRPSSPADLLQPSPAGEWVIDPVIVDSGLQLLILWARAKLDQTPLPSSLGCYHRCGAPPSGEVRCEAEIHHQPGNPTLRVHLRFYEDGRLFGWMEDMRVTCSRELNRLARPRVMTASS